MSGAAATRATGTQLTPREAHGGVQCKRDDLYTRAGVRGGKVRTCWQLATAGQAAGHDTLVTAGSRHSPQANIVAQVARYLGMATVAYVPHGQLGAELRAAQQAGCELVRVRPGHNSVIRARARVHAAAQPTHCTHIPFGMECAEATAATAAQVPGMPARLPTLWVPAGSGMSLAGILHGLLALPRGAWPHRVVGVCVGADPTRRLDAWAPPLWRAMAELVQAGLPYHATPARTRLGALVLDPHYEAKLLPHVQPGDGLWVVGRRQVLA